MIQAIKEKIEEIRGIKYISAENERIESKKEFHKLARNAKRSVFIVAGELTARLYDDKFPEIIAEKIQKDSNFMVKLLFSKVAEDKAEVVSKLTEENPNLASVFRKKSDNIKMYYSNKRPRYHFDVFDDNLRLEEPHEAGKSKPVLVIRGNKEMANEYQGYFDEMCKGGGAVEVIELFPSDFPS